MKTPNDNEPKTDPENTESVAGAGCPASPCSQFLPCPFCGSTNIEVMYDDGYNVGCKDCSTYVAPFLGGEADDKQKHIDFWNTRAKTKITHKADHLARMVCKLLREDMKGDAGPLSSSERRRLMKWATEWLEEYHSANAAGEVRRNDVTSTGLLAGDSAERKP
jgi:hypothetical protein